MSRLNPTVLGVNVAKLIQRILKMNNWLVKLKKNNCINTFDTE